jgi:hypothetical protein
MSADAPPLHVLINGTIFALPRRFADVEAITDEVLTLYDELCADAALEKLEDWLLRNPHATITDAEAELRRLYDTSVVAPPRELDPVHTEARAIAQELILTELAKQGLPPPKALAEHVEALVAAQPEFTTRARARVEARIEIGRTALRDVEARAGVA